MDCMRPLGAAAFVMNLLGGALLWGQSSPAAIQKEIPLVRHAKGTFEVKIVPAESSAIGQEAKLGRMTIDKVFSGELDGSSKGEMLTGITEGTGSMAYVALERVTGKLDGRSGSFVLMHNATMMKGNPKTGDLHVIVVPASGTEGFEGLTGKMTIVIDSAGKHSYDFEYTLP